MSVRRGEVQTHPSHSQEEKFNADFLDRDFRAVHSRWVLPSGLKGVSDGFAGTVRDLYDRGGVLRSERVVGDD
jgi:hypothetical protein